MSREAFETWWEAHGQYFRAGGGEYEKTFAYHAWQAAQADAYERAAKKIKRHADLCSGNDGDFQIALEEIRALAKEAT